MSQPLESIKDGASGYSFPSGYSTCVGFAYFPLAYKNKKYKKLVRFCIVIVLLTMFSRNFVGVHTPQDVIVGALLGIV